MTDRKEKLLVIRRPVSMFDKLDKHHIGFIVSPEQRVEIEKRVGRSFHFDQIQQTHVLFVPGESMGLYIEYICQEGRVARQKPGFAHICYNIKSRSELDRIEQTIQEKKMGYRLTELERSGSNECGFIVFYFIKDQGVVELNLCEEDQKCS